MGYRPLRGFIHGPLNRDGDTLRVKEVWDHQGKWSLHTFPFVLPQHVMDTIHGTPKPLSAYTISSNSAVTHATLSWKWLWKIPTLPRIITFLWLTCFDRLPTKFHLRSRHILHDDYCPLYLTSLETTLHILRDCPRVTPLWTTLFDANPIPSCFQYSSTLD